MVKRGKPAPRFSIFVSSYILLHSGNTGSLRDIMVQSYTSALPEYFLVVNGARSMIGQVWMLYIEAKLASRA